MIELQDVTLRYGDKTVLDRLSLRFEAPGQYAVLGASGCGKTTLLRLIAGLLKPTSGLICIPEQMRMAVCFQEDRLMPWETALQNVALACPGKDSPEIARQWLARVGLATECDALPDTLSGGMQRRVALARALNFGGDVLLLDEPFKGLDAALCMEAIAVVRGRFPLTVIATHDRAEAEALGMTGEIAL